MGIRTVHDLKKYIQEREISPEQLAGETKISNMTIRRLLKKPGASRIPERYHAQFDLALQSSMLSKFSASTTPGTREFGAFLDELEDQGRAVDDLNQLQSDVDAKLKDPGIGQMLRDHVATLLRSIRSDRVPFRSKAIAIGTLLYLINPIDLIPDTIPVVGYLDDFAVLSLGVGLIAGTMTLSDEKNKSKAEPAV